MGVMLGEPTGKYRSYVRRMLLPVFEGVVEALEKHSRELETDKNNPAKKKRCG